jgi:4-hydroxy-tetrahydrodipicolinate reductase
MGLAIVRALQNQEGLCLAGIWVREGQSIDDLADDILVSSDINQVVDAADVIIDFSLPEGTVEVLAAALRYKKPLVCGVSGLSEAQNSDLDALARVVPVVYDRNMSLGVAVLERIVQQAAKSLGVGFAVEIQETHHVHKLDAPSGTALKLGEAISAARGTDSDDIRYDVQRRGEVPGDHTVVLSSSNESLTLGHSVTTRQVFAEGAMRAARWVVGQNPGRYQMRHVLFGES